VLRCSLTASFMNADVSRYHAIVSVRRRVLRRALRRP
jgi:hypothetical protein